MAEPPVIQSFGLIYRQRGDFAAQDAAEAELGRHGFSIGPSETGAPWAVMHGEVKVGKWRNLSPDERSAAHLTLSGNGRHGPLILTLARTASPEAIDAFTALIRERRK
jgi:hypothetical protein